MLYSLWVFGHFRVGVDAARHGGFLTMTAVGVARVFVIDDRITNRNILTRLAASVEEGLHVQAFADPVEALEAAQVQLPDLVITDYKMPHMDGAAFIAAFRALPGGDDTPIVVITVYEDRDYCYRALEAGATDFLLSPVDHLEFRARARNLLTLRRQQKLLEERARTLEATLLHDRSRTAALQAQWFHLLDQLPAVVHATDRDGRITLANQSWRRLFGDQAVGKHASEVLIGASGDQESLLNAKVFDTGAPLPANEQDVRPPDGGDRHFLTTRSPIFDAAGQVVEVISVSLDVTDIRRAEHQLREARHRDRLTGLVNRDRLLDRLQQEAARAQRSGDMAAFVLLDLDRFKSINDVFGHSFGDELLLAVAQRLARCLRQGDTLARLGGDEFAILATDLRRVDDVVELVGRLRESFAEPFMIRGRETHSGASFGIALIPRDGRNADQITRKAELAMYRAKASGRDDYRFYAQDMNQSASRLLTMETDLRDALSREQFVLHYQPQIGLRTQQLVGAEVLVRWQHPKRGLVLPGEFIALCEELGLIASLSNLVMRNAFEALKAWHDRGFYARLAINISPTQFRVPGLDDAVERLLLASGVDPTAIEIELTESSVIEHTQTALESLKRLCSLGVSLSLDDFGTGYSSLSYVRRLPVSKLKIDQSFIHNLTTSRSDRSIVEGIVQLCHKLDLEVVAEGVETTDQLALLQDMGCDAVQGLVFSPAVPAEGFERRFLEARPIAPVIPLPARR
ncbi:MAG: EAL domain-containing protein [Geminicoccaceae bacterium]|nr:MAG: EAL domain-containing protein [Geminicoccaceae bacterium]